MNILQRLLLKCGRPSPTIVIHYHLFKNAGTSIDHILQNNFGLHWIEVEEASGLLPPHKLENMIKKNRGIHAISSHTLRFPIPVVNGFNFVPIIFLRHPLIRLRSAYQFERKQDAQTAGALKASSASFPEYIRWRLDSQSDYSARSFQTHRLADGIPAHTDEELFVAARTRIDTLPFIGIVERFAESIQNLEICLRRAGLDVHCEVVQKNVTDGKIPQSDRLLQIKDELGPDLYAELEHANMCDIKLHSYACQRFDRSHP